VDSGAVSYLAPMIAHPDAKLKRQVLAALGQIAKHSVDLAEIVVEAEVFPKIFTCLKDVDKVVRKNAMTAIREISKHTPELAQLIVNAGGHGAIIDYVNDTKGNARLPGVMALGYIAAFSETLALAIVVAQGIVPLKDALLNEEEDHLKAAAVWSLGQIGRHSADHARALAQADVFRRLVEVYKDPSSSEDLKTKAQRALKSVISKCTYLTALEPLLQDCPDKILKYIVVQFAKVLPNVPAARKSFVQCGGLQKVQHLKSTDTESKLTEYIEAINGCYPPEVVEHFSPNFGATLLKKVEEYQPR